MINNINLFIHFGIYKTGSSFIQTVCVKNKRFLESNGVYFPESKYDERMLAGEISPGNSSGLTNILRKKDAVMCKKLLVNWKNTADKKNCGSILISDEALIHVFSLKDSLLFFQEILNEVGFESVNCFAYFRNPVDHCLSTFKHRAKKGTIPDFKLWVSEKYETLRVIDSFLKVYKFVDFNWKFNSYHKNGNQFLSVFFKDWISLDIPPDISKISVNASLSFSELKLIQQMRTKNARLIPYLYNSFLNISKESKADESEIEFTHRNVASIELLRYMPVVDRLNALMTENDKLELEIPQNYSDINAAFNLTFSTSQSDAFCEALNKSLEFKSLLYDYLRIIKRKVFHN